MTVPDKNTTGLTERVKGITPSELMILLGTRYFDLLLIDVCWGSYHAQEMMKQQPESPLSPRANTISSGMDTISVKNGSSLLESGTSTSKMTDAQKLAFRHRIPGSRCYNFLNPNNDTLFPSQSRNDDVEDDLDSDDDDDARSNGSPSPKGSTTSPVKSSKPFFVSRFGSLLQKPLEAVLGTSSSPQQVQEYSGNGFTHVNPAFNVTESLSLKRRIGNIVIVYDEDGIDQTCHAARVSHLFAQDGSCEASYYLIGGLGSFSQTYPEFFSDPRGALASSIIHSSLLNTLNGLQGEYPVYDLRIHQQHLVDSVWFGKQIPHGDLPLCIVPDYLYLSSCLAASRQTLLDHGITHVLRLGWGFTDHVTPDDGITYHDFPIYDSPSEQIHVLFDETTRLIERVRQNNEKILVHCHAGVSRSSTIILAYMIKYLDMKLIDAWNETYKIRPIIRPNSGFARALQFYEQEHFGVTESTMDVYWMSESYLYYIEYVDVMYRISTIPKLPFPVESIGKEEVVHDHHSLSNLKSMEQEAIQTMLELKEE